MIFSTDKNHFAREPQSQMTDQDPLTFSSVHGFPALGDLNTSFQSKRVISNAYIMGVILLSLSSVQIHKEAETESWKYSTKEQNSFNFHRVLQAYHFLSNWHIIHPLKRKISILILGNALFSLFIWVSFQAKYSKGSCI